MENVKIIEIKKSVFENNDRAADELRGELKTKGVFLLNLMSSPGSGKTTTLIQTINRLKDKIRIAVMEADIDSDVDAIKIKEATGVESIQLHTGGMCHLDAEMTQQGLDGLEDKYDLIILENVGNLVCTAEQDTGANINIEILSVPEGDDKPLKYPLMFTVTQAVLVNKTDTRKFFAFDDEAFVERVHALNPLSEIFFVSAKTGEGFDAWISWLRRQIELSKAL